MTPSTRRRGFTLVELALGATIGSMIMLGIMTLMRGGMRMFSNTEEALGALQSATFLQEIIRRDAAAMIIPPVRDLSGDAILPFRAMNPGPPPKPQLSGDVFELTEAGDPFAQAGPDPKFQFFRTRIDTGGGLLSSLTGGGTADYKYEKVVYEAVKSAKYRGGGGLPVYVLKRTTFAADVTNGALNVDSTPSSEKLFKQFYFRRLVLTLHEADENGIATASSGGPPAAAPPPAPGTPAAPQPDKIYFLRALVAGVAVGPGRRLPQPGERGGKTQSIDLLHSIYYLDTVSDRFRGRSLATHWNPLSAAGALGTASGSTGPTAGPIVPQGPNAGLAGPNNGTPTSGGLPPGGDPNANATGVNSASGAGL